MPSKKQRKSDTQAPSSGISPSGVSVADSTPSRLLRGRWLALWVALLLGAFALQAVTSMAQKSITWDEAVHLPAGYSYLKTGDFRMNAEHPPLAKMISAIPLLFMNVNGAFGSDDWENGVSWDYGWRFLYESGNDCTTLLFWGRLAMVVLSLCLGLLIFFWSRKLYGNCAGLFALFLFAFSPNLIAHGSLTNTDVAFAFFLLLALFCFDRALYKLTIGNTVLAGLTLGLAFLTKFSAPLAIPIMGVATLARLFDHNPLEMKLKQTYMLAGWRRKAIALTALVITVMVIAYAVIWIGYLGRFSARTDGFQHKLWFGYEEKQNASNLFLFENRFLPQAYLEGFNFVQDNTSRSSFLDGRYNWDPKRPEYLANWPHYFIMTTLYKTPVAALVFLLIAIGGACRFSKKTWRAEIILIAAIAVYFTAASLSKMYIGHRHILPVIPPAMIFMSKLALHLRMPRFRHRVILVSGFALLALWYCVSAVNIHPHYLAYFNEIAGGPEKGSEHLSDSNIDWGQDLILLRKYMDEQHIDSVHLIYFGSGDTRYYGIRCKFFMAPTWPKRVLNDIPSADLSMASGVNAGDYFAISVSMLRETGARIRGNEICKLFRREIPAAKIGYSIYVYKSPFTLAPRGVEEIDRLRFPERYSSKSAPWCPDASG